MSFVDYYAVLNLPRDASEQEVDAAFFELISSGTLMPGEIDDCVKARELLSSWRERVKYDRRFGYPMVIQSEPMPMINMACYQLTRPKEAIGTLLSIKEAFIEWVVKKTELPWEEAEKESYSYDFRADIPAPYLILRFQQEREQVSFANKLTTERKIKV